MSALKSLSYSMFCINKKSGGHVPTALSAVLVKQIGAHRLQIHHAGTRDSGSPPFRYRRRLHVEEFGCLRGAAQLIYQIVGLLVDFEHALF